MSDSVFKIVLEAMAMEIDRLKGEVFIRNCEKDRLKEENQKLREENKRLQESVNFFMHELKGEEVKDG